MSLDIENLSAELLTERKKDLAQLVKDLQIETELLQYEVTHTEQVIQRCSDSETEIQPHSQDQKMSLKQLENLLSWCKNLTGFVMGQDLLGYTVKNISDHEIIREYRLHVLCSTIELYIVIQLKSDLRIAETNYEIVKLKVEVPDKDVADEIVSTLEELEKSLNFITIVRFLSSYGKERKSRETIFEKLANDPDRSKYVMLSKTDSTKIKISDPDCASIKIKVQWLIKANLLNSAYSDLKASYTVSKSKLASSGISALEDIPSIFSKMVASKGHEFAIFALVDMMINS